MYLLPRRCVCWLQPTGDGCVLATEKGQLFHIMTTNSSGRPALGYKHISRTAGVLQWGMRSLFGFGAGGSGDDDTCCVASGVTLDGTSLLALLTKRKVYRWKLSSSNPPEVQDALELTGADGLPTDRGLRERCRDGDMLQILDATMRHDGLAVLVGLFPRGPQQAVLYSIGLGVDRGRAAWFPVPATAAMRGYQPSQASVRLLMEDSSLGAFVVDVLDGKVISMMCDGTAGEEDDAGLVIEGPLLGVGMVGGDSIVFSRRDNGGVVRVAQRDLRVQQEADREAAEARDFAATLPANEQQLAFLSRAFNAYCAGLHDNANKLFAEVQNPHVTVKTLSDSIADTTPEDPRWAETAAMRDQNSMASMILLHQLEGKAQMHRKLIEFLKETTVHTQTADPLWETLTTRRAVLDNAEKIAAAIGIRTMHPKPRAPGSVQISDLNREFLDEAIKAAMHLPGTFQGERSANDKFYQTVTGVDKLLPCVLDLAAAQLGAHALWAEHRRVLHLSSDVLITTIRQVRQHQTKYRGLYTSAAPLSWTASKEFRGLCQQASRLIVEKAIQGDCTAEDLPGMYRRLFELGDGLLDGYGDRDAASFDPEGSFDDDRKTVLQPFLPGGRCPSNEWAYQLATKHHDYTTLVMLCEQDGRAADLEKYSLEFGPNFVNAKFEWYFDQGKKYKLLNQSDGRAVELEQFLQSHNKLAWLQHIHMSNYSKAHRVLEHLSLTPEQPNSVARKRTLLSLSSLALLASDVQPGEEEKQERERDSDLLVQELFFLKCQEMISAETLEAVGHVPQYDLADEDGNPVGLGDTIEPLDPADVMRLLIGDDERVLGLPDIEIDDQGTVGKDERPFVDALKMAHQGAAGEENADIEAFRLRALAFSIVHDRERWEQGRMPEDEPDEELITDTLLFNVVASAADEKLDMHGIRIQELCETARALIEARQPGLPLPGQFQAQVNRVVEKALLPAQ